MTDDVGSQVEEPVAKLPAGLLVEMFSHLVGELEIVTETCRTLRDSPCGRTGRQRAP